MKKCLSMLLALILLFSCSLSLAEDMIFISQETERLPGPMAAAVLNGKAGVPASNTIFYTGSIDPPSGLKAATVNTRVHLSWQPASAADLYGIYEKVNGKWTYLDVTTSTLWNFTAKAGKHTYGVSSIWRIGNNFYESAYVVKVDVTVKKNSDKPGTNSKVYTVNLKGTKDKTLNLTLRDDYFLQIKTDALTWITDSSLAFITPPMNASTYFTSLGKSSCINLSRHAVGKKVQLLVSTYNHKTRKVDGKTCYAIGAKRAYFTLNITLTGSTFSAKYTLSKSKATLVIGKSLTLKPTNDLVSSAEKFTWTSSDKKIATVSSTGVVKALKKGTVTITCKRADGKKATCRITVDPPKPTKVTLDRTGTVTLKQGKTLKLNAKLAPTKAESKLTWTSSNKKIATVTSKGAVKGIKKGTVTVTVKTENGLTAKVKIKVN